MLKIGKQLSLVPGDSQHKEIKAGKLYLAAYDDRYILGTFTMQWYGWSFNWFWSVVAGIQLDRLSAVYETNGQPSKEE